MAMMVCKDCKEEISSEANKCSHCGAITERGKERIKTAVILTAFIIFVIVMIKGVGSAIKETNEDKRNFWGDLAKVTITSEPEYCIDYK